MNGFFILRGAIMNKLLLCFGLLLVPFVSFAEDPPMRGWEFNQSQTLNGHFFSLGNMQNHIVNKMGMQLFKE
jgi:hypothetical protein